MIFYHNPSRTTSVIMAKFNTSFYSDVTVTLPIDRLRNVMKELAPFISGLFSNSKYLCGELRFITNYLTKEGQIARWIADNYCDVNGLHLSIGSDVSNFKT